MGSDSVRDRLWLWGTRVNAMQAADENRGLGLEASALTPAGAMDRTGIHNLVLGGSLPLSARTLASIPQARRLWCKLRLYRQPPPDPTLDEAACLRRLREAKRLAGSDRRVEGLHLDDFCAGRTGAGARPEQLGQLLYANAVRPPRLPLSTTVYPMDLDGSALRQLLPYFDQYLLPLWYAEQVELLPSFVTRLAKLSGGKPVMLCLYVYDFGSRCHLSGAVMQRHLEVAERLLCEQRVSGLCLCGTCLLDLDWEANRVLCDWLERVGDTSLA